MLYFLFQLWLGYVVFQFARTILVNVFIGACLAIAKNEQAKQAALKKSNP